MSLVPMGGNKISPNPCSSTITRRLHQHGPRHRNIARKFGITREQADEFSANSHKKALAAIAAGNFKDETISVEVKITSLPNGNGNAVLFRSRGAPSCARGWRKGWAGEAHNADLCFDTDELPRADTSLEVLAKLKPPSMPKAP